MTDVATEKVPCPNPACNGRVLPDETVCVLCHDPITACPNCGAMMSQRIGRCGRCGYGTLVSTADRTESEKPLSAVEQPGSVSVVSAKSTIQEQQTVVAPPTIISFEASRPSVKNILADAYSQAARADGDMREATRVLEQLRATWLGERDALKIWRVLNEAIGHADAATLQPALIDLRNAFKQQLFAQETDRLRKLFDTDRVTGWREWLRSFAEGLAFWRLTLCQHLVDASFPFPEEFRAPYDFKRCMRLVLHERWTEVFSFFLSLANHDFLHSQTRTRMLITAGQIHLYYFSPSERALELYQQGDALSPNMGRVLAALGDYHLRQDNLETARTFLDRALGAAPDEVEPYIYLGDLLDRQAKLEEAINWYQEAISKVGGDGLGYTRLLRAYGRPEMIDKYEAHITPLAKRAVTIDETGQYRVYLDVGDAYLSVQRFDVAQEKYQDAIDSDPDRLDGYTWKGFAYLQEGDARFEDARRAFEKAIDVAPEAYDGYWGMGQLCEREGKKPEAIDLYYKVAQRRPELQATMFALIGRLHRDLEQNSEAEAVLLTALRIDGGTEADLLALADDYYRKYDQPEAASDLFKRIRDIRGESFEAAYQNRLGNIDFYYDRNEEAARHYLNAIAHDPKETIYYSNLARVYSRLGRWTDAHKQLQEAFAIDGDEQRNKEDTALAYNEQGKVLSARGDLAGAAESYQQAIQNDPNGALYHSNLAEAYVGLSRWADARTELEKAAKLDTDQEPYKQRMALTYNEEGNAWFAQGEFERAITSYDEAEALGPSSPRYPSNRALAREKLAATSADFISQLDRALADARTARERAEASADWSPLAAEFSQLFTRLERERKLVNTYGSILLNLVPKDDPIRISVGNDIAALILNSEQTDLAPDFMKNIAVVRDRIQKEYGFAIPSFNFAPLTTIDPSANYELRLNGEAVAYARLELNQQDCYERLLEKIELDVIPHLEMLCGHQDAANQLRQSEASECAETLADPFKLHRVTLKLKEILASGQPIVGLPALCAEINQTTTNDGNSPSTAIEQDEARDTINSITLYISEHSTLVRDELAAALTGTQNLAFNVFGVTIPQTTIRSSNDLKLGDFEIQFEDERLGATRGLSPGELWVQAPPPTIAAKCPDAKELNYSGQEGSVVPDTESARQELESEHTVLDPLNFLTFCFAVEIRKRIWKFLDDQMISHYLALLNDDFPDLCRVTGAFFTTATLTTRAREVLKSEVSIRNMPAVLEFFLSNVSASATQHETGQVPLSQAN